nr:hypothetical protein Iba_chr05eCG5660 [Ipomoea batatas]
MKVLLNTLRDWLVRLDAIALPKPILLQLQLKEASENDAKATPPTMGTRDNTTHRDGHCSMVEIKCPHEEHQQCPTPKLESCNGCWEWVRLQNLFVENVVIDVQEIPDCKHGAQLESLNNFTRRLFCFKPFRIFRNCGGGLQV